MRRGRTPRCWARACPRESGGGRAGAAGDRAQRASRGLDHRRHGLSQEGAALGRGDPAILRPARQAAGVAVTLSLANHEASLPVAYRLYLPEDWAKDQARRDKAKIPETIAFQTKPEIALEQIKATRTAGLPQGVVLMDAGYGNDT